MQYPLKSGMTLTELLVSSILVGIVMIGVGNFSASIKRSQETTHRYSHIGMQLSGLSGMLKQDALLAVGENSNRGVVDLSVAGTSKIVCFRHDQGNITTYADDLWQCWHAVISSGELYHCGDLPSAINNCSSISTAQPKMVLSNPSSFFTITNDADGRLNYVSFDLRAREDLSRPADPIKNPEIKIVLEVAPVVHSK
jgi:prepilin-type N-terminal cleavage/methylation domain-containing protein